MSSWDYSQAKFQVNSDRVGWGRGYKESRANLMLEFDPPEAARANSELEFDPTQLGGRLNVLLTVLSASRTSPPDPRGRADEYPRSCYARTSPGGPDVPFWGGGSDLYQDMSDRLKV